MLCEKCGKVYKEDYRKQALSSRAYSSSRFCSRQCANSRTWTSRDIEKKRNSALISERVSAANEKRRGRTLVERIEKRCPVCDNSFSVLPSLDRKYCSKRCYNSVSGGFREGSAKNHIHGTYNGYYYDSSWELIWIRWALQNKVVFERNTEGFSYIYKGALHKYYPDFYLPEEDRYVEIKGRIDAQWKAKELAFPRPLEVISKADIYFLEKQVEKLV